MSQHAMTPGAVAADVGLGDDDLEMGAARRELEEAVLKPSCVRRSSQPGPG